MLFGWKSREECSTYAGEESCAQDLMGKLEVKRQLGKPRCKWKNITCFGALLGGFSRSGCVLSCGWCCTLGMCRYFLGPVSLLSFGFPLVLVWCVFSLFQFESGGWVLRWHCWFTWMHCILCCLLETGQSDTIKSSRTQANQRSISEIRDLLSQCNSYSDNVNRW
jgi:hypothetical protein